MNLKIPNKQLTDNFNLQDFKDDFTSVGNGIDTLNGQMNNVFTVDINKFGVVGDNVTDITTPLKLAIAEASASFNTNISSLYKKGGVVKLPKGVFVYSDTIRIPTYVSLQGEGVVAKWGYDLANPTGTILKYTGASNKPGITFVGLTSTGTPGTALIVNGTDLDAGTYSQTYGASLKNISVIGNSQEVGVVFSGCPESEIENVSIQGFDFTLISSGNWGSKISNLFLRPLFCGYYGGNNVHNPIIEDLYIDKSGTKTTIASGHSCYNLANDVDLKYKNADTGFISLRHYNLNACNIIIEHFTQCAQFSSDNANANKISNIWSEGNTRGIAIMYGIYKIECVYSYGATILLENYDGHVRLEGISGDYTTLYATAYGSISYENCATNGDIRSSYNERLSVLETNPAFTTLALSNGWTGTIQYSKNALGLVTLKINAKGGTTTADTIVATLPVGLKPTERVPVPTMNMITGSALIGLVISTTGDIAVSYSANLSTNQTIVANIVYSIL